MKLSFDDAPRRPRPTADETRAAVMWGELAYAQDEARELRALVADLVDNCVGKTCEECRWNEDDYCKLHVVWRCMLALEGERR